MDHELDELLLLGETYHVEKRLGLWAKEEALDDILVAALNDETSHENEEEVLVPEALVVPQQVEHSGIFTNKCQDQRS